MSYTNFCTVSNLKNSRKSEVRFKSNQCTAFTKIKFTSQPLVQITAFKYVQSFQRWERPRANTTRPLCVHSIYLCKEHMYKNVGNVQLSYHYTEFIIRQLICELSSLYGEYNYRQFCMGSWEFYYMAYINWSWIWKCHFRYCKNDKDLHNT